MERVLLTLCAICIYDRLVEIVVGHDSASRSTQILRLQDGSPIVGNEHLLPGGKRISEFLGIPYAEAPIGQRRFSLPVEKSKWTQVFNATKLPNSCPQTIDTHFGRSFRGSEVWNANTRLSEDCLYVNVWTPRSRDRSSFPVMVWIYGGGFTSGTSTLPLYDGKTLASEENVIVVSFNYRVTAFGFLYLGIPEAPGNMGLQDQYCALKWINQNIEKFNGDPHSITLFGESAGADSINLHAFSSLSKTFFKRSILQSGVALAPWSLNPKSSALDRSLTLARHLGCYDDTTDREYSYFQKIFQCLIRKSMDDILEATSSMTYGFLDLAWAPIIDGQFLVEDPRLTMERDDFTFHQDQVMIGTNQNEGNYFLVYLMPSMFPKAQIFNQSDFLTSPSKFEKAVLTVLPANLRRNPVVCSAVLFEYTPYDNEGSSTSSRGKISARTFQNSLDNLINDFYFTCDSQEMAKIFTNAGKQSSGAVFYYRFSHRSSTGQPWPRWMGVLHGDEIAYVFGEPLSSGRKLGDDGIRYSEEDRKLSRTMMRYWANFARTGNPNINPDGSIMPDSWPIFTNKQEYKILSARPSMAQRLRSRQCVFWKQYIPYLYDATRDLTEAEVRWKREFTRWHNEYIVDWKNQFDQYRMLQGYKYYDSKCNGP